MGCYFLLLGIFLTQGSNPGLLHWQADSLLSEPPGEPNMSIWNSNVHVCRLSFIGKQSHPFIYGLSMVTVTISAPWSCCHRDHLAWKAWNIYYPASCFKRKPSCLAHQQLPLLWITRKHTSTAIVPHSKFNMLCACWGSLVLLWQWQGESPLLGWLVSTLLQWWLFSMPPSPCSNHYQIFQA